MLLIGISVKVPTGAAATAAAAGTASSAGACNNRKTAQLTVLSKYQLYRVIQYVGQALRLSCLLLKPLL